MCSVMFCLLVYVLSHVMCDSGSIIIDDMLGSNNVLSDILPGSVSILSHVMRGSGVTDVMLGSNT